MKTQFKKNTTDKNKQLLQDILSGKLAYVEKIFRIMISKGHFACIRRRGPEYISSYSKEISQEIFISIFVRKTPIDNPKSYIWCAIFYMSLKENRLLNKIRLTSELYNGGENVRSNQPD